VPPDWIRSKSTPEIVPAVPLLSVAPAASVRPAAFGEKSSSADTLRVPVDATVNPKKFVPALPEVVIRGLGAPDDERRPGSVPLPICSVRVSPSRSSLPPASTTCGEPGPAIVAFPATVTSAVALKTPAVCVRSPASVRAPFWVQLPDPLSSRALNACPPAWRIRPRVPPVRSSVPPLAANVPPVPRKSPATDSVPDVLVKDRR
jgi:hypothetical protein